MTYLTNIFETSDDINNFHQAWANAVTSERAKSTIGGYYKNEKIQGWITSTHVVLYNVIRGYDSDRGFTKLTNKNKSINQTYINYAHFMACARLNTLIRYANNQNVGLKSNRTWELEQVEQFLEPFNGTFTIEMLAKIPKQESSLIRYKPNNQPKQYEVTKIQTPITTLEMCI